MLLWFCLVFLFIVFIFNPNFFYLRTPKTENFAFRSDKSFSLRKKLSQSASCVFKSVSIGRYFCKKYFLTPREESSSPMRAISAIDKIRGSHVVLHSKSALPSNKICNDFNIFGSCKAAEQPIARE